MTRAITVALLAFTLIGAPSRANADRDTSKPNTLSTGFSVGMFALGETEQRGYISFAARMFAMVRFMDSFLVVGEAAVLTGSNTHRTRSESLGVSAIRPALGLRWEAGRKQLSREFAIALGLELGAGRNAETWEDGITRERADVHFGISGRAEIGLSKRFLAIELEFRGVVARHKPLPPIGSALAVEAPGKHRQLNDLGFMFMLSFASR